MRRLPSPATLLRRPRDRGRDGLRAWRFELQLGVALIVSLGVVLIAGQLVTTQVVTDGLVDRDAEHAATDARSIETAFAEADANEDPLVEAREVVATIARRPGVVAVHLVDAEQRTVASSHTASIGERHHGEHFAAALRERRRFAGRETSDADAAERASRLEFVEPLTLHGRPFALEVDADGRALERHIAKVRAATIKVSAIGFMIAFALFYLLGGRSLSRRHRNVMRRATRDPLTDLGNHRAFQEEIARALSFAARVLGSGRPEDRAFRIGGDEFAVLFPGTDGAGARRALERMLGAAQRGGAHASCTAGIAAMTPSVGDDAGVIWEQADAALCEGKRGGGGALVVFDDVAELLSVVTPAKVRALRALLDDPRLDIAYQPILRLRDREILGMEALARPWEGYGFDGPADAFAVAEKIGRAHELDSLCRSAALARAADLPDGALLFVNVHPQTLDHDALDGEHLLRAVAAAGLEPSRVVLEVTERSHARLPRVVAGAARLRALGFRVALDDVGSGNAGLETLRQLTVDFVKIDRSIVAGATTDVSAQAVLVAIVAYARRTGALVIAEGIESEAILAFVRHAHELDAMRDLSIEGGQGYLLGRPALAPEPLALIA